MNRSPARCVRTARFKYILNLAPDAAFKTHISDAERRRRARRTGTRGNGWRRPTPAPAPSSTVTATARRRSCTTCRPIPTSCTTSPPTPRTPTSSQRLRERCVRDWRVAARRGPRQGRDARRRAASGRCRTRTETSPCRADCVNSPAAGRIAGTRIRKGRVASWRSVFAAGSSSSRIHARRTARRHRHPVHPARDPAAVAQQQRAKRAALSRLNADNERPGRGATRRGSGSRPRVGAARPACRPRPAGGDV